MGHAEIVRELLTWYKQQNVITSNTHNDKTNTTGHAQINRCAQKAAAKGFTNVRRVMRVVFDKCERVVIINCHFPISLMTTCFYNIDITKEIMIETLMFVKTHNIRLFYIVKLLMEHAKLLDDNSFSDTLATA